MTDANMRQQSAQEIHIKELISQLESLRYELDGINVAATFCIALAIDELRKSLADRVYKTIQ